LRSRVRSDEYNILILFVYYLDIVCILFYLFFVLLVFGHYRLDVSLFEKIQDYEEKTVSSSKREARQVTLDHIDRMCFISLVYTLACIL
jgi:hypothetical protein